MTEQFMENISNEEHERLLLLCGHGIGPSLSPAAQAVLTALTQQEYDLDPADISNEAGRMACIAAAALRAAVAHTQQHHGHDVWECDANELLAIAAELEGASD